MTEQEFLTNCVEYAYRMAGEGVHYDDGTIVIDPEDFFFRFAEGKKAKDFPDYFPDYIKKDWEDIG